jgi:hypothetical protein
MMNPLAGPAGPGKFSTRTDKLELGSTAYGEGVETQAIKSGAPLAKTGDVRPARAGDVREAATAAPLTGLFAMSDETRPITAGLNRGPGPGSEALMMNKSVTKTSDTLAKMLPFDTDGSIAILYQQAVARGD